MLLMRQSVVSFSLFAQAATHLNAASPRQCPTAASATSGGIARQSLEASGAIAVIRYAAVEL